MAPSAAAQFAGDTDLNFCRSKYAHLHKMFGTDDTKESDYFEDLPVTWARASACFTYYMRYENQGVIDTEHLNEMEEGITNTSKAYDIDERLIAWSKDKDHIPEGSQQWMKNYHKLSRHALGTYPDAHGRDTFWWHIHFWSLCLKEWLSLERFRHF